MKRTITKFGIFCSSLLVLAAGVQAQSADTTAEFKPSGTLWGYTFGDYSFKNTGDNLNRGGSNQYTGMAPNASEFQFRRIYLGYNYNISPKFSAEFLLAMEDDFNTGSVSNGTSVGDVTAGGKFSPYVKYGNLKWKNIFKNSDLKIGSQATPSFAKTDRNDQTAEEVWGYRCVERTVSDIRRTPSFDMGASLQGWFNNKGTLGYMFMVGNGNSAKPETDAYKWFYGDVYAKLLNKRLLIDVYADYERLAWGTYVPGVKAGTPSPNGGLYSERNMTKLFVAWNTNKLTVGFEGFQNVTTGEIKVMGKDKNLYYRTDVATAISCYVRGRILSASNGDPKLNFFARYDNYDPSGNLSTVVNEANTASILGYSVSQYDPFTKEQFVTFGIDWMPYKNVHFIPNVWLNTYTSSLSPTGVSDNGTAYSKIYTAGPDVTGNKGTDCMFRLTFYYIYNPKQGTTKY
jgi:hypothetical protein